METGYTEATRKGHTTPKYGEPETYNPCFVLKGQWAGRVAYVTEIDGDRVTFTVYTEEGDEWFSGGHLSDIQLLHT